MYNNRNISNDVFNKLGNDSSKFINITNISRNIKKVIGKSQKYFVKQQEYLGHVNGQVEEVYGGHNIVKVFGREEQAIKKNLKKKNQELYKSGWRSQFLSGLMYPLMNFVGNVGYVAVAILGRIFCSKRKNNSRKYTKFYTIQ